jgi:hypothetical protein
MQRWACSASLRSLGLIGSVVLCGACGTSEPPYVEGRISGGALSAAERIQYNYETPVRPPSARPHVWSDSEPVATAEGLVRKLVTYSTAYDVDGYYEAMVGPSSSLVVALGGEQAPKEPEIVWIKGIAVEVVDERGEVLSEEYTCHMVASIHSIDSHDAALGVVSEDQRFTALAQGFYHKEYPDGFGLPVLSTDSLSFSSQVLNYNTEVGAFPLRLRHRVVTLYIRDSELSRPMKAITNTFVQSMVMLDGEEGDGYFGVREPNQEIHGESCAMGVKADSREAITEDFFGRRFSAHWLAGPGRSATQTLVTKMMKIKYDTRVHVIDVHLHPFGESVELRDLTAGETVFRSTTVQRREGIGLASVQAYRSEVGLPVYADHEYALVATYDNTRGEPSDAMAIMYLGLHDPEFDPALVTDSAARAARHAERVQAAFERRLSAVEKDPADPEAQYFAGLAYYTRGDLEAAVEHLAAAARLKPGDPRLDAALARALAKLPSAASALAQSGES